MCTPTPVHPCLPSVSLLSSHKAGTCNCTHGLSAHHILLQCPLGLATGSDCPYDVHMYSYTRTHSFISLVIFFYSKVFCSFYTSCCVLQTHTCLPFSYLSSHLQTNMHRCPISSDLCVYIQPQPRFTLIHCTLMGPTSHTHNLSHTLSHTNTPHIHTMLSF